MGPLLGTFVVLGLFWSVLAGPQLLRQDFRQDWRVADILKSYPVAGWGIVLGELLAPAVILAVAQWALLGLGVLVVSRSPDGTPMTILARLSVAVGAAMILPVLNLVSLLMPNAAVLLFPAWFQAGQDSAQGLEATGQRLIFALGQMLVFLVALLPAAVGFGIVFFVARLALGWIAALPLASAAATVLLAAEVGLGIALLGKAFERFDLAAELPP